MKSSQQHFVLVSCLCTGYWCRTHIMIKLMMWVQPYPDGEEQAFSSEIYLVALTSFHAHEPPATTPVPGRGCICNDHKDSEMYLRDCKKKCPAIFSPWYKSNRLIFVKQYRFGYTQVLRIRVSQGKSSSMLDRSLKYDGVFISDLRAV